MTRNRRPRDALGEFRKTYLSALRDRLGPAADPDSGSAGRLGHRASELGLRIVALARIHEEALSAMQSAAIDGATPRHDALDGLGVRAASFFSAALAPMEATHEAAVLALADGVPSDTTADGATDHLAHARHRLVDETARRTAVQESLDASERENRVLLEQARVMTEELRHLSRSLLASHEEERRRISRELHDALGQSLSAINIGLASLKAAAAMDSKVFRGSVSRTQRLVQQSMKTVHQFARNLRPTLLDDLGLVPALRGFAQEFGAQNNLAIEVSAPKRWEHLDEERRTALFRVAQEALVNVGRHAGATNAKVTLRRTTNCVSLEVWNDGTPFDVEKAMRSKTTRHLGLLCMRERMDMVGGTFSIRSSKELGTTVLAEIPLSEPAVA
jgi:signal transduction histidine kinase